MNISQQRSIHEQLETHGRIVNTVTNNDFVLKH